MIFFTNKCSFYAKVLLNFATGVRDAIFADDIQLFKAYVEKR